MNSRTSGYGREDRPSADLAHLSLSELRDYRAGLAEEEERVSYWRRLVQARLDTLQAASRVEELTVDDLVRALSATGTGSRRQQLLRVHSHDALPELPELDAIWAAAVDPHDEEQTRAAVAALQEAEQKLTGYRHLLHARLDAATGELISRYRSDTSLASNLLEQTPGSSSAD